MKKEFKVHILPSSRKFSGMSYIERDRETLLHAVLSERNSMSPFPILKYESYQKKSLSVFLWFNHGRNYMGSSEVPHPSSEYFRET